MRLRSILFLAGFGFLCTCASAPSGSTSPAGGTTKSRQLSEGYSLLYKLMGDEGKVDGILVFKHTNDTLGNLIREIAGASKRSKTSIKDFQKKDSSIKLDVLDLPKIEQDARDQEASLDTKALFGSSGGDFELELIFTQMQAMGYAQTLCDSLAAIEDNADRKAFLTGLAGESDDFHKRLSSLISVKTP